MWLLVIEGLGIGCLLGLTGAGGGILAIPLLMNSQGWSVSQAAPIGLLAVTLSAAVGMIQGFLKRIVRYRAALWISLFSIPSTHYGIYLSNVISPLFLAVAFALVMLFIAYRLFFSDNQQRAGALCYIDPQTKRLIWNLKTATVLGALGVIAGLLTGLLGVGGGFVLVPALRKTTNLDMQSIVATSLMIIFLIGGLSIGLHIFAGFHYPISITVSFVLSCIVGMLLGLKISRFISTNITQKIFATTVVVIAVHLLLSQISH